MVKFIYAEKATKFCEISTADHKILRNLHRRFDLHYIGQIYGGDFAKFCGLLRIYELYKIFISYFSEAESPQLQRKSSLTIQETLKVSRKISLYKKIRLIRDAASKDLRQPTHLVIFVALAVRARKNHMT